jgi:hypothetical protein
MKRFLCSKILLFLSFLTFAQGGSSDKYISVLQQVINDVRNDFNHIKSKSIKAGIFESKQVMPGSQSCMVRVSPDQQLTEWIASFKSYDDKQKAETEFRQLSSIFSNAIIKVIGEQPYILNGRSSGCINSQQLQCTQFQLLPQKSSNAQISIMLSLIQANGKYNVELIVKNTV